MAKVPTVTKAQIVGELRRLGLKEGDVVMAHSSLSSFGRVLGGAKAVVDALLETVGRKGTLLMPILSFDPPPYDFRKSRSWMGKVTEEFKQRPGVVCSLNPGIPPAALGPRAEEFVGKHHECDCPYVNSPYDLAAKAGGYVLLLGADQDRNTTMHCVEGLFPASYLQPYEGSYVDRNGKVRTYRASLAAGPHRDFIGVDPKLRAAGIVKMGRIGNCVVRLMKGQELIDFCLAEMKKDPNLFLTPNNGYADGVFQRGMVRAARLGKEESFALLARTSSAGRNMEEVIWHASRAGATALEVDVVDGRDLSKLDKEDLAYVLRRLGARKMRVDVVRSGAFTHLPIPLAPETAFQKAVEAGQALKAKAVIAPLTGSLDDLRGQAKAARKARLQMLFENVGITSKAAAGLMAALAGEAAMAFNPGNFVLAGELPFLRSIKAVKKYVRYLAITDCSPLGVPCLPGNGCGEVKELISLLRCSSWNGWMSLAPAPGAGLDFDQAADAFYKLLDSC